MTGPCVDLYAPGEEVTGASVDGVWETATHAQLHNCNICGLPFHARERFLFYTRYTVLTDMRHLTHY
jgi:hypothetical protein